MTPEQVRRRQYKVAQRVLSTAPARDYQIGPEDYNTAFRAAGLPEIIEVDDLIMLLNGDPMSASNFRTHMDELIAISGLEGMDSDTTLDEAIRRQGMTGEQAEAFVEKRVRKRKGAPEH